MSFQHDLLETLGDSRLLRGDAQTAYRDPTAYYLDGVFHLFFTLVETEPAGAIFEYLAKTTTRDFREFTPVRKLTPRDQRLNYSSPGNIIVFEGKYWICFQSYCRENGEKYGNENSRLYTSSSADLESWSEPEMLQVKGDGVPFAAMGRMIDPYYFFDLQVPGKIWCFFKQDGISRSWSTDLKHWHFEGAFNGGENSCVVTDQGQYYVWSSPHNGISLLRGSDLDHLQDTGQLITLGQRDWPWAQGRLTAGFVLDLRQNPDIGVALLFYHGTGPEDESVVFDQYACLGIAWSRDLLNWHYPEEY